MFIRDGGIARLAELSDDTENAVRLNALWAVKNSLFKATSRENRTVLAILGFPRLNRYVSSSYTRLPHVYEPFRLLDETTDDILEQVLGIVRNVTAIESDAEWLVPQVTASRLLAAIERALVSESTALAALFLLDHLSYVYTMRTQILSRRRTLEFVSASLSHRDAPVRCAAAQCVGRLAGGTPRRLREMREVGIDTRLRMMKNTEEDSETRDHVKRAWSAFEAI